MIEDPMHSDEGGQYTKPSVTVSQVTGEKMYNIDVENVPKTLEEFVSLHKIGYAELAAAMGVSRMTLHVVRKRERQATAKFLARFERARRRIEMGQLAASARFSWKDNLLIFAANAEMPLEGEELGPNELLVRFRGDEPGENLRNVKIKLTRPRLGIGVKVIRTALVENDCDDLLRACLPAPYQATEWIERMNVPSYLHAIKKCVSIILGPGWETDLASIVRETEKQRAIAEPVVTEQTPAAEIL
jgi:hypothetical protein